MRAMLGTALAAVLGLALAQSAFAQLKVASDTSLTTFTHLESVGCDAKNKAIYVSEFGSKLAPLERNGAGCINKRGLTAYVPDLVQSQVRIIGLTN
jgi:hypothetical protein